MISSRPQMFFKVGIRKILLISTNSFIKKRAQNSCFPVKLAKFLGTSFLKEQLRLMLLYIFCKHDVTCNLSRWNYGYNGIYKKRSIKAKAFWKNSFVKQILHKFSIPVTMCVYINTEYWPEYSFKILSLIVRIFLKRFSQKAKEADASSLKTTTISEFLALKPQLLHSVSITVLFKY